MKTKNLLFVVASLVLLFSLNKTFASEVMDPTGQVLTACLNNPLKASTADQEDCEAVALKSYDKRMNLAYSQLIKTLPTETAMALKTSQRSWINYRDMETRARDGVFGSRQGTMYAPMQADAETLVTRDRALLLERYVRVMEIDVQ